jgi:acyl-CoA thioesterase I
MPVNQSRPVRALRPALFLLFVGCLVLPSRNAVAAPLKVACIGEHTTHSDLYANTNREAQPPGMQEYPRMLQDLMGSGYDVRNFGDCCASVVQGYAASETHPYLSGGNYKNSVAFAPDIVVIGSWGRHDWGLSAKTALSVFTTAKFQADYDTLVKAYLALKPVPKIYCALPIPILNGKDGPDNGFKTSPVADAIKAVAAKYNLPTIDLFSAFLGHPELYRQKPLSDAEGEHASDAGMQKMAALVHAALIGTSTTGAGGSGSGGAQGSGGRGQAGSAGNSSAGGSVGSGAGDASVGGASSGGDFGASGVAGAPSAGAPLVLGSAGASASSAGGSRDLAAAGALDQSGGAAAVADPASPSSNGCACNLASSSSRGSRMPWGGIVLIGLSCGSLFQRRRRSAVTH